MRESDSSARCALNLINMSRIRTAARIRATEYRLHSADFTLTAGAIVRMGSTVPFLSFDGLDAIPDQANDNPGNGGKVTLNINTGGLSIGSQGELAGINASGGLFGIDSTAGGNGGNVTINATGDVTLLDGDILGDVRRYSSGRAQHARRWRIGQHQHAGHDHG